ncbi:MAG: alpha-1,2-fucosyltransferase [Caulobacteraceae bacterium]
MKTVKIQGGLGNQLFGLAFAHSIVTLAGAPVALDLAGFRQDRYGHRFLLDDLTRRLGGLEIVCRPLLARRAVGALMRGAPWTAHVGQGRVPGDAEALRGLIQSGAYFDGYWQNEAYVADPEFVRAAVRGFLEERGGQVEVRDVIIHYRTYKDEVRPGRRGAPEAAYFQRAIEKIEGRGAPVGDIALISDDIVLAMDRLGDLTRRVTPLTGTDAWTDMAAMLKARSLILGNSSFSWWGGFCGEATTVVYPRRGGLYHYPAPAARFLVL